MVLYKYMKRKDLLAFLAKGTVRIGTLYDYRKEEEYGGAIGDESEGVYETVLDRGGDYIVNPLHDTPEAEFCRNAFKIEKDTNFPVIEMQGDAKIIHRSMSPNVYIYCTTLTYDRTAMEEFGYDSCLEIFRPDIFINELTRKLRKKAKYICTSKILYSEKSTSYKEPLDMHPSLVKSKKYTYQCEARSLWAPRDEIQGPIILDVRRAIMACRELKL
ncbi:TPA: hypothetical protein ACI4B1_000636 [Enterobacter hormaechei]